MMKKRWLVFAVTMIAGLMLSLLSTGVAHAAPTYTLKDANTIVCSGDGCEVGTPFTYQAGEPGFVTVVVLGGRTAVTIRHVIKSLSKSGATGSNFTATYTIAGEKATTITILNPNNITPTGFTAGNVPTNGTAADSAAEKLRCEAGGTPLAGVICAFINGLAGLADTLFESFIIPNLQTNPISFETNKPIYQIWNGFRIIGNLALVAALFVIVFSQATKGPSIDAYTIKKIMPRLLLVAVLINISIYLVSILLDLTNIIGAGLRDLIVGPVAAIPGMMTIEPGGWFSALGVTALVTFVFSTGAVLHFGGAAAMGAIFQYALLFIIIPAVLALIGVLVMLILRQGVILFLVVISPIAFVLYCLPNTEQYFKRWWDTLFQMLLVYPIVIVFISIGSVLSAIFTRGQ